MKLCKDCEHFEITCNPQKIIGLGYIECGKAHCKKHDMYVDWFSKKKFETLECVVRKGGKA